MLLWFFDLGSKLSKAHIQLNVLLMIIQMKNSVAFKIIAVNSFFPISFLITENLAELFENTSIRRHTAVVWLPIMGLFWTRRRHTAIVWLSSMWLSWTPKPNASHWDLGVMSSARELNVYQRGKSPSTIRTGESQFSIVVTLRMTGTILWELGAGPPAVCEGQGLASWKRWCLIWHVEKQKRWK